MPYIQEHTGARRFEAPLRALSMVVFAAALVAAGSAQAAEKSMPAGPTSHVPAGMHHANPPINQKQFAEFKKTREELIKERGKLGKIQAAALKAHPELVTREKGLAALVAKTMKKNGYDSKAKIAELKALRGKLRDKSTPKDKKQALVAQFQSKLIAYRKAQYKALQDKHVQKERRELGEAVIAAMKKQDPKTGELLASVKMKEKKLLKLRTALMAEAKKEVAKGQAEKKAKSK